MHSLLRGAQPAEVKDRLHRGKGLHAVCSLADRQVDQLAAVQHVHRLEQLWGGTDRDTRAGTGGKHRRCDDTACQSAPRTTQQAPKRGLEERMRGGERAKELVYRHGVPSDVECVGVRILRRLTSTVARTPSWPIWPWFRTGGIAPFSRQSTEAAEAPRPGTKANAVAARVRVVNMVVVRKGGDCIAIVRSTRAVKMLTQ